MRKFLNEELLIHNEVGVKLYNHVKDLPIIDYHCHLNEFEIASNYNFKTITELWLKVDHYKWRVMRSCGGTEDDLRILIAKKYLIPFDSGIIVIKHWNLHNKIPKDRYKETHYKDEKAMLKLDEKGAYTLCIQNVYSLDTQVRVGKVRQGEYRLVEGSGNVDEENGNDNDETVDNSVNLVDNTIEETTAPTEPEPTQPSYTEEELEILAIIIYQEAGGDESSDDTRRKVGSVFLNRVASDYYPNTFLEVALQEAQYGELYWTGLKWPDRHTNPYEAEAVQRAYNIAEDLLINGSILPSNVIYQAQFEQGDGVYCYQDGTYFCYKGVKQ